MTVSPSPAPTLDEVARLHAQPLLELVHEAARVHRQNHDPRRIQASALLSIKTGACPEDCGYCPQSAHHDAPVEREELLGLERVVAAARAAKERGADRFCMGAAWRGVRDGDPFDRVLAMVREVKSLGLETCATLGMLDPDQARRLREAGLDYYNHNLDTSRDFYGEIISTRTYDDRLDTLRTVRASGMNVCCGGILGMGESEQDRVELLHTLASLDPAPESVPLNALVPAAGTPLAERPRLPWDALLRCVAVARILMPQARVRLSAGRDALREEAQALCFLAGANSIFLGDRLLTAANRGPDLDDALLRKLGLEYESEGGDEPDARR